MTPSDSLSFVNCAPPKFWFGPPIDEVHISVTFSWDMLRAEILAQQWSAVAPVKIGGPATGQRGEEFTPGQYLRPGVVITSRGCPNRCWFCSVWRRDGVARELAICDGSDIADDNLLACSDEHIRAVMEMLSRQKEPARFSGGLEALRLRPWHVEALRKLSLGAAFFAYDTSEDLEPLRVAGKLLINGGVLTRSNLTCRCYVLIGYPKDTYYAAERRIWETMRAGFLPYLMLYRDDTDNRRRLDLWEPFCRRWRPSSLSVLGALYQGAKAHLFRSRHKRKRKSPGPSSDVPV